MTNAATKRPNSFRSGPDESGHFGAYGGRFVAETLMPLVLAVEEAYTKAKADRSRYAESGSRRNEDHGRIVVRHDDVGGIDRQDLDIRTGRDGDLRIRLQVSEIRCRLTHALDRVHHIGALREKSAAELLRPRRRGRHHVQDRGEWQ